MKGDRQSSLEIHWQQVYVVERFTAVLYPFDIVDLLRQIPAIGYIVPELVFRTGAADGGSPIATKGDVELVINQANKTLGVKGRASEKTVEAFRELREFCFEHLDISERIETHYVELNAEGWAKSLASPIDVFNRFWEGYERLGKIGKVLGSSTTNYGIQLVPASTDPNVPDWYHIFVDPQVATGHKRYHVRWLWRAAALEESLKRFSRVDEELKELMTRIEGS